MSSERILKFSMLMGVLKSYGQGTDNTYFSHEMPMVPVILESGVARGKDTRESQVFALVKAEALEGARWRLLGKAANDGMVNNKVGPVREQSVWGK
ncbi:unnamed protein product [Clonostachys byssicola]|uniref:Uncharacterized protein n=1 Tax=Clonostachys byssicola TaxID=160290 RepID=A0A9N9U7H3_9HYPO|nr:unnamed protein product [Clonostachys byssicola]